jgi:hypothetical protein
MGWLALVSGHGALLGFHWKAETLWPLTDVTIHSNSLFFPFLLFIRQVHCEQGITICSR